MRQIFFDTETTGLDADKGDRVVEIGCVEMVERQLTGRHLHLYLNPERDMPEEAFKIHGLSSAFLHLNRILVKEGDAVQQGEVIAEVGATGRVSGPHLDWRMNWLDQRLDVQRLLPPAE